jgi:hypothetical protein
MRRILSSIIGLVGGVVDLWAGSTILLNSSMRMGQMAGSGQLLGYFLSVLGVIVLLSGLLMIFPNFMSRIMGLLMIIYGSVMMVLGVGMIGGLFNVMMQWSALSGVVMIALGLAMLYSGWGMPRKGM